MTSSSFHIGYKAWYDELLIFAINRVKNYEDAQDIVQEAFIKLWRSEQPREVWRPFLWTVVKNAAIDILRMRQKHNQVHEDIPVERLVDSRVESDMIEALVLAKLAEEIQHLPVSTRKVFSLYWQGKDTVEIMKRLGLSRQNVLNQKAYAIKLLRQKMLKAGC